MRRWLGCVVLACACGPKIDDDGGASGPEESSSGDATTSMVSSSSMSTSDGTASTSTSTSAGTSVGTSMGTSMGSEVGTDPSDSIGETGCDGGTCEPCGPGCVDESDCIDGEWMCNCVCDDPPSECPAAPHEEFANQGKSVPVDCGSLTPLDDLEVWQAMQDCVLWQVDAGGSFFADYTTGDEPSWIGVAGADGVVYATAYWETSGFGTMMRRDCENIELFAPDCEVVQGATCLACYEPGEDQILCDPK
ncbi:MAG TPA: hypothetical protein VG755_46190 [Nannocystaceae bacterium]|nr:hypothetical protein [Nannocystaceae bacterium]